MPSSLRDILARLPAPALRPLTLALLASLYFTLAFNQRFLVELHAHGGWMLVAAGAWVVTALQFVLLALVLNRWTAKPLLFVLLATGAGTSYFIERFGIYFDAPMLRNVLATDFAEARELLAWDMLPHLLYWLLPSLLLWRVTLLRQEWRHSLPRRLGAIVLALLAAATGIASVAQELVPLMREHKELRYHVTPGNVVYAALRVIAGERQRGGTRQVIGQDARHVPPSQRPTVLLLVIGETVRAANWGLDGYTRQTTPQLAALDVVNFTRVSSCGTNTEVSVPCMFSPGGRAAFDPDAAANSESLLHVLTHAGLRVLWRDNQSGCKGVCDGLPVEVLANEHDPALCNEQRCLDEILLRGLDREIRAAKGDVVIVLHMLGNHGPAYFQRYPDSFRRYTPTCDTTDLGTCSPEAIVNSYDNAVLYTDAVLAEAIALLKSHSPGRDTALLYVSDHGESLGEHGLYLHSLPYAIAPDTQTHVPMVLWLSPEYRVAERIDWACLQQEATRAASHDNLFHTVLGLMDVRTALYDPARDLVGACRKPR